MKRSTRAISMILAVCMLISVLPPITTAFAASNFEGTFEGQASDVFTALGFDTSVKPEGYDADTTGNPYGRDTVLGNQVFEAITLDGAYGSKVFGKDDNDLAVSSVGTYDTIFGGAKSDMEMVAVAAADLDGDGLPGEVVYVGYETVPATADENDTANLQLQLYDAKTDVIGTKKTIGAPNAGRAAPSGGNQLATYDHAWQNMLQVTAGDYDCDGTMEIAVYVGENANARVDIYKFQRTSQTDAHDWLDIANWDRVWTYMVSHKSLHTPNMVSLASGDFNRDGIDDLGISYGLFAPSGSSYIIEDTKARILWGATNDMLQTSDELDLAQKELGEKLTRVSLTTGDLDGDGYKELIATGQPVSDINAYYGTSIESNSKRAIITYLYDGQAGLTITYSGIQQTVAGEYVEVEVDKQKVTVWQSANGFDDKYYSLPTMRTNAVAFKPQGAEYTYLYLDSCLYEFVEGQMTLVVSLDDEGNIDSKGGSLGGDGRWSAQDDADNVVYNDYYTEFGAVAADIKGNGYDVLITSIYGKESKDQHHINYSFTLYGDASGKLYTKHRGTTPGFSMVENVDGTTETRRWVGDTYLNYQVQAMVDVDLDTTIIKYTGNHYLKYSDPKIHAVIAAAPYFEDVERVSGYDYAWQNTTSFSKMQGEGDSEYASIDLEAGFWLTQEFTRGGGKAVFEEAAMVTLEWQEGDVDTTTTNLTFETSGNEDAVAFFSAPIEYYEYEIYTPDGNGGYDVELDIISRAYEPVYQTLSLDYYESIRKDFSILPAVAGNLIKSTPGDPASYPSSKAGYEVLKEWDREPAGVSFGNGSVSQEISVEKEEFKEYNVGATVDFKAGGGGEIEEIFTQTDLDLTGGFQFSLNPSKGWSEFDLTGSTYSGTVTNMPEEFRDYGYYFNWELVVFKHQLNQKDSIPVITYLVNDVSAPPELPDDFQQDYDRSTAEKNVLTWTYDGAFDNFYIYKYYDFPVGGGHQKMATISSDTANYTLKYDENGRAYKEYYFEDENLAAYTEYKYAIQVERLSKVPPLSAPSQNLIARTKAAVGNPVMTIVESDGKNDGTLHVYPDKNYYLTAAVTGPDGEDPDSYYTTVQYLWQKKEKGAWVDQASETNKTLTLINTGASAAGEYRCRINALTKADATAITTYTGSVELTHAKRSAYFEELYVRDVSGGGIELYAKVANAHSDSAMIPYGKVDFTLTHNASGAQYAFSCPLNKAGIAGVVLDDTLPKGMYTVYAYCDSTATFKSCEAESLYLSQSGEGYDIDAAREIIYGDGADITFRYVTKTAGITVANASDAASYTLFKGDEVFLKKLAGATSVKVGGTVTRGKNYVIKIDGFDHYFTASHSGTVSVVDRYVVYDAQTDITDTYLYYTNIAGLYDLAENTPAGGYVLRMAGAGADSVYAAFTISPKDITLRLPAMKGEEGTSAAGESSDAPNILLGELQVLEGGYAACDMDGDQLVSALANMVVDVRYIDTADKAFTRTNVDALCGFYTVQVADSTLDKLSNYNAVFEDGTMSILGATRKVTLGARPFEGQQVGTLYAVSPEYGYTRADIADANVYAQDHATGTRLVFTAVPDEGYEIYDWYIGGVAQGTQRSSISHVLLAEDTTVEVQFVIEQNTLIFGTDGDENGGEMVCTDPDLVSGSSVLANAYFTFTAKANPGYHFKEWRYSEDGKGTIYDDTDYGKAESEFELLMPGVSCSLYAVFERDYYTLTYTDRSGENGLTAWYMGSPSGDATAAKEKIYVASGEQVKGDTPVTIEPKAGYALDSRYAFVSEGTQGTADYDGETYVVSLKEDTHISANTVRERYDVTVEFDIAEHFAPPSGAMLTYSAGDDRRMLIYDPQNPVVSATLSDVPGGTPIYVELSYPAYYVFDGFTNVANQTAATKTPDRAATYIEAGTAVKQGGSYYYETKVGDNQEIFYFIAPCDGNAHWVEGDVTVYTTQLFYEIAALDRDETITAHLTEKPVYEVTMPDITDKGTYTFERPDGSTEKTVDGNKVITLHEGDDLSVLVTPEPKWTVSYWNVSNEEIDTYTRATSLKYTIPAIDQNFTFIPVFSATTYNIISWTEIARDKNGLTLSPTSGYLSNVASGNDFKFTLSGPSMYLLSQVLVNGEPFVEAGSADSNFTYEGDGAQRVYTISNIHENMVITTVMRDVGVYVDGVDIGNMTGSGWRFDPVNNKLYITHSSAVVSGNSLTNVPNLTLELSEDVISIVFKDLTLDPTADATSNRTAVTALAEMLTVTMTGDNFIEGTLKGTSIVLRGGGELELESKSDPALTAQALTLTSTGRLHLNVPSGTVAMKVAGTVNFGAEVGTANVPILKSNGGIVANTVNIYNGDIAIVSPTYAIRAATLHNYNGTMDLTADNYVIYIEANGTGWRSYAKGGHTLVYSKEIGGEVTQEVNNQYGGAAYIQLGVFRETGANGNKSLRYKTIGTGAAAQMQVVYDGVTYTGELVLDKDYTIHYYIVPGDPRIHTLHGYRDGATWTAADKAQAEKWQFVAVYRDGNRFDLSTSAFEWGAVNASGAYPASLVQKDTGVKYEYTLSGYIEDNSVNAQFDNIKKIAFDNLNIIGGDFRMYTYNAVSPTADLITNELYLYGDNYIVNHAGPAIEAAGASQVGASIGLRSDGTGTLMLESRTGEAFGTMTASRLRLAGVKSLTAIGPGSEANAFNFYSGIDFVEYTGEILESNGQYSENSVSFTYGQGWLQEVGTTAATAKAQSSYQGMPDSYTKIYGTTADASFEVSSGSTSDDALIFDREGGQDYMFGTLSSPKVNGKSHRPVGATLLFADGLELELTYQQRSFNEAGSAAVDVEYLVYLGAEYLSINMDGPRLQYMSDGQYTLRFHCFDEDPSDATFYYFDVPLTIVHSTDSDGNLAVTPFDTYGERGDALTFEAAPMTAVPSHYKWSVDGVEFDDTDGTFTYTIPNDAEIDSEIKVRVESYAGEERLGYATAVIYVLPSIGEVTIGSDDLTANDDGSYTIDHAASDVGTWQFDATVLYNDGYAYGDAGVVWSLWGNLLRSTSVDAETGVLTIDPKEIGVNDQLRLTATAMGEDGQETSATIVINLITDAFVSYNSEASELGTITSVTANGTVIDAQGEMISAGTTIVVAAAPVQGNTVEQWLVNGVDVTDDANYTVDPLNHTLTFTTEKLAKYDIEAIFGEQTEVQITFAAGDLGNLQATFAGESIANGDWVDKGGSVTFTAIPDEYCEVSAWYVNGEWVENHTDTTLVLDNITEHTEVTAEFIYAERVVQIAIVTEDGEITAAMNGEAMEAETTVTEDVTGMTLDGTEMTVETLDFDQYFIGADATLTFTAIPPEGGKLNAWAVGADYQFETASNELTFTITPGYDDVMIVVFFDGPIHTHDYTVEMIDPTCEGLGYTLYSCECGYSYKMDYIDAYGHGLEPIETVDPTCTADGYTLYECGCGYSEKRDYVSKLDHALEGVEIVAPTCTAMGYTLYECECGYSEKRDYLSKLDHALEAVETIQPTCTASGYTVYECDCGYTEQKDRTDATGHALVVGESFAPTCTALGYTLYACDCGYTEQRDYLSKLDHKLEKVETVQPTCTTSGYSVYECACGYTETKDRIDATGHDLKKVETVGATCTTSGYTLYKCDCGYTEIKDRVDATGHALEATETVAPTCTTSGYTVYECACGYSETKDRVDATGHDMKKVSTIQPTCTTSGYSVYECACGYSETKDHVDATGHALEAVETVKPTCTTSGYTVYECACGYSETKDHVDATGHDMKKVSTIQPTCTTSGYTVYECACGYSETKDHVDATGHDMKVLRAVEPTYVTMGHTEYYCECGYSEKRDYIPALSQNIAITATDVTRMIGDLGAIVSVEQKEQVEATRAAYDSLMTELKPQVYNYAWLASAEGLIAAMEKGDETSGYLLGDVSSSGTLDVADIMRLKNMIMIEEDDERLVAIGDIDTSGKVDVADITVLKKIIMVS